MRMWMVRNQKNFCSRPVHESVLKGRIETGEVGPGDEICPSAGYWFSIDDSEELRKFLGDVKLPGDPLPAGTVDVTREMEKFESGETGSEADRNRGSPRTLFWSVLVLIFWAVFAILWTNSR